MAPYPTFPIAGARHLHLVREEAAPYDASDADVLESLGDEIATLAAHIHAATHRLLVLLAGPTPSARVPPTNAEAGSATAKGRAPTGSRSGPGSTWGRPAKRCAPHGR